MPGKDPRFDTFAVIDEEIYRKGKEVEEVKEGGRSVFAFPLKLLLF
jgi:hypothetical protein